MNNKMFVKKSNGRFYVMMEGEEIESFNTESDAHLFAWGFSEGQNRMALTILNNLTRGTNKGERRC